MTEPTTLPHALDRVIHVRAPREAVFRFFTDPRRWATWWGAGSTIDATPGGRLLIRYPNGIEASGEVLSIAAPESIVFTFGYASGQPVPAGSSRVTIRLEAAGEDTRVRLTHEFGDPVARDMHAQGWRYQLSLFANVVADDVLSEAPARVDAWFAAWREPDAAKRADTLAAIARPDVSFRDRHSALESLGDLLPHIEATRRFMPGVSLAREGEVRRCQHTALANWVAAGADGAALGRGTNVFTFAADGRIASVVGVWTPAT